MNCLIDEMKWNKISGLKSDRIYPIMQKNRLYIVYSSEQV